jgi:hypothetical protein
MKFSHGQAWWLATPYLLASAASAVTIGKDGSNVNYLFELSAAWSLSLRWGCSWPGWARPGSGDGWRSQHVGRDSAGGW